MYLMYLCPQPGIRSWEEVLPCTGVFSKSLVKYLSNAACIVSSNQVIHLASLSLSAGAFAGKVAYPEDGINPTSCVRTRSALHVAGPPLYSPPMTSSRRSQDVSPKPPSFKNSHLNVHCLNKMSDATKSSYRDSRPSGFAPLPCSPFSFQLHASSPHPSPLRGRCVFSSLLG